MTTQVVNPFNVESENGIDYNKLIGHFGCDPIDGEMIKRFEKVTGKRAHLWLRRGLYFSHKDFSEILDSYEKKEPIYLYTGRGPSSEAMHLGHMIPFMFTKYLQDVFDAIVIIQLSDDEKFYFKDGPLEEFNRLSRENAKDIIACGFNLNKTYIFSNLESFGGKLYETTARIMKATSGNQMRGIYGPDIDRNVGTFMWPCMQCAPAFSQSFPFIFGDKKVKCLVPMAIDQAPYFRMARDFAKKNKQFLKPATIHSKFLVALEGIVTKMSTTGSSVTIFLTDTEKKIRKKINKYGFSGGKETLEEHRRVGGNLNVDVAYQYLIYFEPNDDVLNKIAKEYSSGHLLSGQIKKMAADAITKSVLEHQRKRAIVTKDVIDSFFSRDRKFDMTVSDRELLEICDDETYNNYGMNFDSYFGIVIDSS
jgi:tryptophanyl-tRNA synthetase